MRKLIRKDDERYQHGTYLLSSAIGIDSTTLNEWCECVGALHDVGKLTREYVDILHRWQKEVCNDVPTSYLAHSDFNPNNPIHKKLEREYRRPSHAPAGAIISIPLLEDLLRKKVKNDDLFDQLFQSMVFSMMRHHGAYVQNVQSFKLVDDAEEVVEESLEGLGIDEVVLENEIDQADANDFSRDEKLDVSNDIELIFYWYFSRRLRLADQRSQEQKANSR